MVGSKKRCVIVSASPELESDFIKENITDNDYIICADGGTDKLITTGLIPDLIVGDLDSSENYGFFKDVELITLQVQKDDTDTMHCAQEAVKRVRVDAVVPEDAS